MICQNNIEQPIVSTTNSKSRRKKSNHQQKIKKGETNNDDDDTTSKKNTSSGLEANVESECQNDIENSSSLLGATSLGEKFSKEDSEKIPLEVLEYLENIEQENQVQKERLESLKKPLQYVEKLWDNYEKLKVKNQELEARLEDARLCKVCMEVEICFVFIPCGHQCTCENCAVNGDLKNCPICREKITKRIKTFLP